MSHGLSAQESKITFSNWLRDYPDYLATGFNQTLSDRGNRLILGSAAVSIILLSNYDKRVQEFSQEKGLLPSKAAKVLDEYGGGWAYPLTFLCVGITSIRRGDDPEILFRKYEYVMTSFALTATVTSALQWGVGRERPNKSSLISFPSGHTSGSFVVAATLDELYGHKIGIPAYITAGLVGLERIHDNKHWLTDVIAGAALGTVIGRGFGYTYRERMSKIKLTLVPGMEKQMRLLILVSIN